MLTGGGTVQNGLFAGTVFQNINAYEGTGIVGVVDRAARFDFHLGYPAERQYYVS